MNRQFDLYICHDGSRDTARLLSAELRFRGYCPYCIYSMKGNLPDGNCIRKCRYTILVLSNQLFENHKFVEELRKCRDSGAEIIPICLASDSRGFPATMQCEFAEWRSLQVSVISEDNLFEKSIDKLIEDRFAEDFKAKHRIRVQSRNGLSLNTLRLVDIIRNDGESLNRCLWRVFNRKIDESHFWDWDTLDY